MLRPICRLLLCLRTISGVKGERLKSYPFLITPQRFILVEETQRGACGGLRPATSSVPPPIHHLLVRQDLQTKPNKQTEKVSTRGPSLWIFRCCRQHIQILKTFLADKGLKYIKGYFKPNHVKTRVFIDHFK